MKLHKIVKQGALIEVLRVFNLGSNPCLKRLINFGNIEMFVT